ncbi:MAG: hypothetical protein K9M07_05405 [Simkaniaceae bacterium]|nr:hypothetical protein [Simkaniaceae bacterium]MCF7852656.1 hypothetical protein [Simkaniaceae bacterium]
MNTLSNIQTFTSEFYENYCEIHQERASHSPLLLTSTVIDGIVSFIFAKIAAHEMRLKNPTGSSLAFTASVIIASEIFNHIKSIVFTFQRFKVDSLLLIPFMDFLNGVRTPSSKPSGKGIFFDQEKKVGLPLWTVESLMFSSLLMIFEGKVYTGIQNRIQYAFPSYDIQSIDKKLSLNPFSPFKNQLLLVYLLTQHVASSVIHNFVVPYLMRNSSAVIADALLTTARRRLSQTD